MRPRGYWLTNYKYNELMNHATEICYQNHESRPQTTINNVKISPNTFKHWICCKLISEETLSYNLYS